MEPCAKTSGAHGLWCLPLTNRWEIRRSTPRFTRWKDLMASCPCLESAAPVTLSGWISPLGLGSGKCLSTPAKPTVSRCLPPWPMPPGTFGAMSEVPPCLRKAARFPSRQPPSRSSFRRQEPRLSQGRQFRLFSPMMGSGLRLSDTDLWAAQPKLLWLPPPQPLPCPRMPRKPAS